MKATDSPITAPHGQASIFTELAAPFPPSEIQWRTGATNRRLWEQARPGAKPPRRGQALPYVDARMIMDRLDTVMGEHWQVRHTPMPSGVICSLGLLIGGAWVWRSDGAGPTGDVGDENEREMAIKGSFSDALKRAGVLFGIGRSLYRVKAPWIDLDERWRIPDAALPRLAALLEHGPEPLPQQNPHQARKSDTYPRVEKKLRAARTLRSLAAAWKSEQATISRWPDSWQTLIIAEKDRCKDLLSAPISEEDRSGLLRDFQDSVAQLNGRDMHEEDRP